MGRDKGLVLPNGLFLSEKHANFFGTGKAEKFVRKLEKPRTELNKIDILKREASFQFATRPSLRPILAKIHCDGVPAVVWWRPRCNPMRA